ncbi:allatostatins MIP [Drosophila subpulchrella]|uniref:allatostatins MIP n=1 Tax=Drosophila subpulchrella TaxID=1486046 RepID=UPI0018A1B32F|nr:allatostatins MIP [Drosophila subpulchrella]
MAHTKTRRTYEFLLLLLVLGSACGSLVASGSASSAASNEPGGGGLSEQVVLDQLSESDLYGNNKRAWQSLQSSWGKRSSGGESGDPDIYMTGHFVPLVITDGTNTIDWETFERLASGQTSPQQQQQQQQSNQQQSQSDEDLEELGSEPDVEKRAWKSMNVAWGKRRQAQGWNKFRGAWGKREPTWNNLKGMWGKRDQWQKLHGGWGKRSQLPSN